MDSAADQPYPGGGDEVSRQREKRSSAFLARLVPGFPGLTLGQTVAGVALAGEQAAGVLDVERFLADQGHDWRTIKSVLAYLASAARHPSGTTDEAVGTMTGTVIEFPARRRSSAADTDVSGGKPADPAPGPHGPSSQPAAVTTDPAAGDDLPLPSGAVGAPGTEQQELNGALRLQVLKRLQALLLPE